MDSRLLIVVAAIAALVVAIPNIQVRKGATPLPNEKPNTFRVDIAFRVVEEAGGLFVKPDGTSIRYNREDVYNREGYVIVNRKENILL